MKVMGDVQVAFRGNEFPINYVLGNEFPINYVLTYFRGLNAILAISTSRLVSVGLDHS